MPQHSHHIIFNAGAGTAASEGIEATHLRERFGALGASVHIDADTSRPMAERLDAARHSDAPVLVAAGGDGTATALAGIAVETGKTLVVMPLGTANLLARDLGLPLTLDEWFDAYPTFVPRQVDVGEVNGDIFLHKVVIGAVPGLAAAREHVRGRDALAARFGLLMHFARRLSRLRRFAAEITRDAGEPHIERVQSIAVANNSYDEAPGRVFARSRLDRGTLSLYIVSHLNVLDAIRLAAEMVMGTWRHDDVLEIENVAQTLIRTRSSRVRAMVDGEVIMLNSPLTFRIRPLALTVLAPPPPVEIADEPETEATEEVAAALAPQAGA